MTQTKLHPFTYLWPDIWLYILWMSCLVNKSNCSRTVTSSSGWLKFGTWSTAVKADNISISSNTDLRLLVQNTRSFLPLGGCFFSKTNRACNVRLEYLGPIEP